MNEMDQSRAIVRTAKDVLVGASEDGYFLAQDALFRHLEDGRLVADVYDADGKIVATFEVSIIIGDKIQE